MAFEIEHKFLVKNDSFKSLATSSVHILQGYLCREPERTVRVRVMGRRGFVTVKGKNIGARRVEFEFEVGLAEAEGMLSLCKPPILDKTRHYVSFEGHKWEVDEFHGVREGLVTAEIELQSEEESYVKPDFIGEDVTGNPSYYNSNLG